jgi:mediator of RNA polymerase II transcription subunit 12
MKFLDSEAPVLNESSSGHNNRTVFASLVHLYYELIKHDVFSHDMYMCTLISRGDLLSVTPGHSGATVAPSNSGHFAGTPSSGMSSLTGFQCMNDLRCEMDDSKIDDDLGKLLQHIKEEQQIVMVGIFSCIYISVIKFHFRHYLLAMIFKEVFFRVFI